MRSFWTAVVLVASLHLCGCETTPYHRAWMAFGHGYADKEFSNDTFHVAFNANYATSADTLHEYLHRRAAELTLQHGFRYFAVIREPRPQVEYRITYYCREDREAGIDAKEAELPAWGTLQMTIQCFQTVSQAAGLHLLDAMAYVPESTNSDTREFSQLHRLPRVAGWRQDYRLARRTDRSLSIPDSR
jgi:hypothetical protein